MVEVPDIGRVFTPLRWAEWLLEESGAYQAWRNGALICDPNFGAGAFIVALLTLAKRDNVDLTSDNMSRIFGYEIDPGDQGKLIQRVYDQFGVELLPENFMSIDVLSTAANQKFDVLVGNPPWANFSNLPAEYKDGWAKQFIEFGLVSNKKNVLLGSSRADICTLVLKKVIDINLYKNGFCAFYIPLSIFFNSGSNDLFRPYPGSKHGYAVTKLWDFADEKIFEGIATRYGATKIEKSVDQCWPVPTDVRAQGQWVRSHSTASDSVQGFWQRHDTGCHELQPITRITAKQGQQPRQGINTCGANDILMFTRAGNEYVNQLGEYVELEDDLLLPLIDKSCFSACEPKQRLILVPHNNVDGKPLTLRQLQAYPRTYAYLRDKHERLCARKGTMINAHIKRGLWWALLGVGPYSFSRWKVVWEALGKSAFNPRVVTGNWQGNQALHAFCPCDTEDEAVKLQQALSDPSVQNYLKASSMGGTMNWAQPGRIAKIFVTDNAQQRLFA